MAWMVAHSELALDHLGDSSACPNLSAEPKRFSPLVQQAGQLRQVLGTQLRLRTWSWMSMQGWLSLCLASLEPLADGSFAHSQGSNYIFLLPSLLPQFPRSQPTAFFPIMRFLFFLHPSILHCLLLYVKVSNKSNHTLIIDNPQLAFYL